MSAPSVPKDRAMKDVFLVDPPDPAMTTTIVAREAKDRLTGDVKLSPVPLLRRNDLYA